MILLKYTLLRIQNKNMLNTDSTISNGQRQTPHEEDENKTAQASKYPLIYLLYTHQHENHKRSDDLKKNNPGCYRIFLDQFDMSRVSCVSIKVLFLDTLV